MGEPTLPDDLVAYLSDPKNRSLDLSEGEIRRLMFYAPESVPRKPFTVDSYELNVNGYLEEDPGEQREYTGFDLLESIDADYEPEGILVWFPDMGQYGSWDCDHLTIITYPDASWAKIVANPVLYVNGQWYPERVKHVIVNPWA